jgi:hypothetical protein
MRAFNAGKLREGGVLEFTFKASASKRTANGKDNSSGRISIPREQAGQWTGTGACARVVASKTAGAASIAGRTSIFSESQCWPRTSVFTERREYTAGGRRTGSTAGAFPNSITYSTCGRAA